MRRKLMAMALAAMMLLTAGCDDEAMDESNEQKVAGQHIDVHEKFPAFKSKTLNGSDVSNEIFIGKQLTVCNIWGTFCPPCIAEMPELGEWANEMPEGVQLIGLVCDVQGEGDTQTIEAAKRILHDADANFLNIIPSADMMNFLSTVEAVPTTIFIDGNGNIVGAPVVGADVEGYKDFVDEYLGD